MSRAPKNRHQYRDLVLSEHGPSTSAARLVALALTADMDGRTLETFCGVELLAKRTKLVERTVRTALHTLRAEGWIEERTKGRGRDYALRIRRATLPPGLPAMVAATQRATAGNGCRNSDQRVAANGELSTGKSPHGVPAMVAAYPLPEIPNKNPGATSPLPADAGSAAQRRWSRAEVLAREEAVKREKETERREANCGHAVDELLRSGKAPEQIAGEFGKSLEYVLARKRMMALRAGR